MLLAARSSAQTLPGTNQCVVLWSVFLQHRACLWLAGCPPHPTPKPVWVPLTAQVDDKAQRQHAGTRRFLVFEGSWCSPQPRWAELALSQVGTRSGRFKEGRLVGVDKNSPLSWRVLALGVRLDPHLRDCGEHPLV